MNKNSGHIDEKLLLRFLHGEANQDEIKQVTEWLQLSDENQKLLDSYESIWAETGKLTPNPVAVDIPSAWNIMSNRVDQFEKEKSVKTISLRSRNSWIVSSAAAIIIILFGIYQLIIKPDVTIQNIQLASAEEIINDTLSDGTLIALNANSKISYPEQFAKNERRVKLEGEAFFNVESNKEKPFVIEAANGFVQVLGTSFNVKAYENSELEVIVTEGLVKLYTVDSETLDTLSILLKAGQKGKLSKTERKPVYISENIPDEIFWMNYTLIFNDTDLKKVFTLLEYYYKVKINVDYDEIYDCRLTTTFSSNAIDEIIQVIVATFDFEFVKENNIYTIKGNGCAEQNI